MRGSKSTGTAEVAVSSVTGTVLMLVITITVFGAVSVAVLDQFEEEAAAPRADLGVQISGSRVLLLHRGGESLMLSEATLLFTADGVEQRMQMDAPGLAAQTADGANWRVGEGICLAGPQPPCLHAKTTTIGDVRIGSGGTLIVHQGDISSTPAGVDLQVAFTSSFPDPFLKGDTVTFAAIASNVGDLGTATTFRLSFRIDGTEIATGAVDGLAPGATTTVTGSPSWTATTGIHDVTVVVDVLDDVAERAEGNNEAHATLEVVSATADPGFPFLDLDGDAMYDPDIDTAIPAAEVMDGTYDAGAASLVIPGSVGAISAGTVDLRADGDIHLDVDLTGLTHQLSIEAGGVVDMRGVQTSQGTSTPTVSITAGADVRIADGTLIGKTVTVTAQGGRVEADATSIRSTTGDVHVVAATDIEARGAAWTASRHLMATLGNAARTIYVQGATFIDNDNLLDLTPDNVNIVGLPASGGFE